MLSVAVFSVVSNRFRTPLLQLSFSVFCCLVGFCYLPNRATAQDPRTYCERRGSGREDAESTEIKFPTTTWAICINNLTAYEVTYNNRWGYNEPYQLGNIAPYYFRVHYCNYNTARAQGYPCPGPFLLSFGDYHDVPLQKYDVRGDCVRCISSKQYYFKVINGRLELTEHH
jgi:hypothetical protein